MESLEAAGFSHIAIDTLPRESLSAEILATIPSITSTVFIAATK